jgi:DNA modification methylase
VSLQIEYRATASVTPFARNARTHSAAQVEQLAASIREFGFNNPILVDATGEVIAGHGRLAAAKLLKLERVPVLQLGHLTDAQKRAYVLADNKIALNAGWDEKLLALELKELGLAGADLALTGFSGDELLQLLGGVKPGRGDPDAAPALQETPVSRAGDVWELGAHRVICGDVQSPATVPAVMLGEQADVVWTDPPYNVAYSTRAGSIANDDMPAEAYAEFLGGAFGACLRALREGGGAYVAHADTFGLQVRGAFCKAGFKLSGVLIWRKDALVLGRSDYQWQHEPILYGWKPGARHAWFGGRKQTTVMDLGEGSPFQRLEDGRWAVRIGDRVLLVEGAATVEEVVPSVVNEPRPRRSDMHPTMKPVALIDRMLRNSARTGAVVLDPFGGSGSTMIAAEQLGMRARLVEIDPKYCDVIVRRWQEFTGQLGRLAGGAAFAEIAAERGALAAAA